MESDAIGHRIEVRFIYLLSFIVKSVALAKLKTILSLLGPSIWPSAHNGHRAHDIDEYPQFISINWGIFLRRLLCNAFGGRFVHKLFLLSPVGCVAFNRGRDGFALARFRNQRENCFMDTHLTHDGVIVAAPRLLNKVFERRLYFVAVFNTANAIAIVCERNKCSLRQTLDKRWIIAIGN